VDVGAPELLILLIVVVALVGLVPTVIGISRAASNNDTGWLVGIILGWLLLGVGWIVAIVYLATVDGPRRRDQQRFGWSTPAPPPPGTPLPAVQPAGWFPDPSGRCDQRYWDGQRWTEHVMRGSSQGIDRL
jgi:hypothetical protein